MRKAVIASFALAVAAGLVAAATATGAHSTGAAIPGCGKGSLKLIEPGVLTLGTDNPAYPPWWGYAAKPPKPWKTSNPYNGQGYESAVAYAVAKQLGFTKAQVKWTPLLYTLAYAPGKKKFDFYMAQISYKPERARQVDFSRAYYFVNQAVVGRKGTPIAKAKTIRALKPYKLGVALGTTSYDYIVRYIKPSSKPNVFDNNDTAIRALKNGQIDGIVVDLPTAFYVVAAQLDDGVIVGKLPTKGTKERFGLVFQKGNPLRSCVDRALGNLWANGSIAKFQRVWLAKAGAPDLK